ncbi:12344_t:CDS:2, partial [Dentiscutata erythropus]
MIMDIIASSGSLSVYFEQQLSVTRISKTEVTNVTNVTSNYSSFCSEIQDDFLVAMSEPLLQDAFEDMPEPLLQDTLEPLSQDTPNVLRSALIELDQNVNISQIEIQ